MSLRQKLALGFGGLLVIIAAIGIHNITRITALGQSIDVILRENYRSVVACQEMKEALERMDSGAVFVLLGAEQKGNDQIAQNEARFEKALQVELGNITLPGEGEKAERLKQLFGQFRSGIKVMGNPAFGREARRKAYFDELLPLFQRMKDTADDILRMNQENMVAMDARARRQAQSVRGQMYMMLLAATIVAAGFLFLTGKWILRPITRLTNSAKEIRKGNLDLVLPGGSRDEIGQLSEAFNEMTASLREFRRSGQARLLRIQRSTQQAFDSLPEAIAVLNPEGEVEVATEAAGEAFGLRLKVRLPDVPYPWMADLFEEALRKGRTVELEGTGAVVQQFVRNEERFYRPKAVPILDAAGAPAGVVLILHDVTQQRQLDEKKSGAISAVSHQLKTPLTSIRMAIHLLLEEKVGALSPKQADLLVAAVEDAERLDTDRRRTPGHRPDRSREGPDGSPSRPADRPGVPGDGGVPSRGPGRRGVPGRRPARDPAAGFGGSVPGRPCLRQPALERPEVHSSRRQGHPLREGGRGVRPVPGFRHGGGDPGEISSPHLRTVLPRTRSGSGDGGGVGPGHREGHRGGARRDRRGGKPGRDGKHVPFYPAEDRPRRHGKETDMIDGIYLGIVIAMFGLCALFAHSLERM